MTKGIIIDDLSEVIERLRSSDFDDTEFAYNQLSPSEPSFDVAGETIHTIQGEVTYPRDEFAVEYETFIESDVEFTTSPPGILPYLKGAYQLKGSPSPRDVGLPMFTNDSSIGIRWLFDTSGSSGGTDFTDWGTLTEDEVNNRPEIEMPDKDEVRNNREGANVSPGFTYPEDERIVKKRIHDNWWEVWCARCQELMDSWRVILPAGSADPRPILLAPNNTVVSNNFNFIIFQTGKKAVATAAVLGSEAIQEELPRVVPWSKGGGVNREGATPRPGVKHFRAILHQHRSKVKDIVDDNAVDLSKLADEVNSVHESLIKSLENIVAEDDTILRDYYTSISDSDALENTVKKILSPDDDETILIQTTKEDEVEIGFDGEPELAASAAVTAWLIAAQDGTVANVLDTPVFRSDADAVRSVLYEQRFSKLRNRIENNYF